MTEETANNFKILWIMIKYLKYGKVFVKQETLYKAVSLEQYSIDIKKNFKKVMNRFSPKNDKFLDKLFDRFKL